MEPRRRGVLLDLDGTIYLGGTLLPGAETAVRTLREAGLPFLFTTNTSRKSRRDVTRFLASLGLEIREEEVFSAPVAASEWLEAEGVRRVQLLLPDSTHADFAGFDIVESRPEAVLVGDLGDGFTFRRMNEAFRSLRTGARLVAIHRNRFWLPEGGPTLDAGPFVAALEYAAGTTATLIGKPSPAFFAAASRRLGVPLEGIVVVGDDPESDVRGGRAAGVTTVQVRTGKFDAEWLESASREERPHHVVDGVGDVPALLFV